jgi:diguanylate cyclase (GGDEF)-like protein
MIWIGVSLPLLAVAAAAYFRWRRARLLQQGVQGEEAAGSREILARCPPSHWIDKVTGLPDVNALRNRFPEDHEKPGPHPLTLLTISVDPQGADPPVDDNGELALMEVAHTVRSILRAGDTCVRGDGSQLMAVLPGLDADTSTTLVTRVRHAVDSLTLVTRSGGEIRLAVSVGRSCVPQDGNDLDALLAAAREERGRSPDGSAKQRLSRAVPMVPN